jgi:nucleoside-diphosphate-sugar epimerase
MLQGLTVAVTGASGFVGARVVKALVDNGVRVHAYGRRREFTLQGASYTAWDITEGPLHEPPTVDAVVHCAGLVSDWGKRHDFQACHVDGTRHVLASFPEPLPVVHVSTASVYDPRSVKRMLGEHTPACERHLNAYCETKALAERLVLGRRQAIVLRPHALYGRGDTVLLPRILDAYRWGCLIAAGAGTNLVSLTHVDNLVDAVLLALQASLDGRAHGAYNVADDQPVKIDDALRAVLTATGRSPRILYLPRSAAYALGALLEWLYVALGVDHAPRLTRYRVVQVADHYTLDLVRARHDLGYRPSRSLLAFIASGGLSSHAKPGVAAEPRNRHQA